MGMNCKPDKRQLTRRLIEIVGKDAVLADERELVVYECDAYTLQRNPPTAVGLPRSTQEVAAVVRLCAEMDVPIIPRGAGTGLVEQIDSLIGKKSVGDIAARLKNGRLNRLCGIDHMMERLVATFDPH